MSRSDNSYSPWRAALDGIRETLGGKGAGDRLSEGLRLDGKRVLVTGATSGLGRAIARELVGRGAEVVIGARGDGGDAQRELEAAGGGRPVRVERLDLARLASVREFAERLAAQGLSFDVIVLNAGVVTAGSRVTGDGFDEMLQVNYLGNALLVREIVKHRLFRHDRTAAGSNVGAVTQPRLVVVSSEAHRSAPPVDWATWSTPRAYGMGDTVAEYGRTKLLLSTMVAELARRLVPPAGPAVSVLSLCPGAVNTRIAREAPAWSKPLLSVTFALFFRSPEKAARPAVYLAAAPELEGRTGVYLHVWTEKPTAPFTLDPKNSARLWEATDVLLKAALPLAP